MVAYLDLDQSFVEQHDDIDQFIASQGHQAYARVNVELYRAIVSAKHDGILALSSGFMTYPTAINQHYAEVRHEIARSRTTFVLLPALDLETCVVETVRRQLMRPFSRRGAAREEAVTYPALIVAVLRVAQPDEALHRTAWRVQFGSSIFSAGRPALAGEFCVMPTQQC